MSALRAVLLASLVAAWLAVPVLAVPTAGGGAAQPAVGPLLDGTNNTSQVTVGQQISGFMQQQTSETEGAVKSGMWTAAFENASESRKTALVNQRTEGMADQVAALQAQRQELIEARKAGAISRLEFRSRMSGLVGQYASLLAALNETEPRAQVVGANVTAIETLRKAAAAAVGPEVAAAAGSAAVVSAPGLANNTTAGQPADVPGQGNGIGTDDGTEVDNGVGNGSVGKGNGVGNGGVGKGVGNGNSVGTTSSFNLSNPPEVADEIAVFVERLADAS